ncbi:Splicing factor 3B subunit 4 [Saguinus oedipus]|uniref:Splicing factor 3B subunit 4 n=1 Tax=Saguinus oedipus TaxID=9490 RepID=A0ABQ9THG0_SAGOE|nr:Splicing factor 3B subunit 4 [Saguinus oedipus]
MAAGPISERNQDATVYVGGLDEKVSEPLLWELFLQAGPVVNTHMPKDRVTGQHQGYGFVEFLSEEDADYAIKIMNMIKLYGKPIRVNKASAHNKNLDVGANIFIGNLDPEIDEKLLYDTFSAFGVILQTPKIMRDPDTGNSKGYAFINFASFDASDAAIEAMNGQYLCNRPITVSYAFKKDSKGERHGSAAERLLAAQNPLSQADRPHQLFADAPPPPSAPNPVVSSLGSGLPPPEHWEEGAKNSPWLERPNMACLLLAPSHPQCRLLEPSHLGYLQPCPHHLCRLGLQDMAPHRQEPQGQDILVTDTHILIHSHRVGCPIQGCLRCSWHTMALMAWDIPMLDPQALGGSHRPDHHLECLILDLLQWACPPEGLHSDLPWVSRL